MGMIHAGMASHGMAWFAREQTTGKGQRGKNWISEPGKNILLSLVIQPQSLDNSRQFVLSAAMALACFEFFSFYSGNQAKIKWPNDLYWRDRKAGGILIENVFHGNKWKYAVVGIGININQVDFDRALKNPVSLKQITGSEYDTLALAEELYTKLMNRASTLNASSYERIIQEYNQHLYGLNEKLRLKKGNRVFETLVKGVSANGHLLTSDAIENEFDFGEVEWVIDN